MKIFHQIGTFKNQVCKIMCSCENGEISENRFRGDQRLISTSGVRRKKFRRGLKVMAGLGAEPPDHGEFLKICKKFS